MTVSRLARFSTLGICLLSCGSFPAFCQTPTQQTAAKDEFFEKKVRPILVKNCQMCHNAKAHTAQLDLSTAAGFMAGGPGGPLVSRDHPEDSRLLKVIGYEDSLKMPPMGKLKDEDIADLTTWVKIGAPWPGADPPSAAQTPAKNPADFTPEQKAFWAFQPPKAVAPPSVKNQSWVKTPIDQFILAKLEERGIAPAPPADKATLLRRATYDLTGLPPTPEEMQTFLADQSANAFEKVVDRLLASPRYGERWGRHWLDVARYADSTGNDEDLRYPYAWRYRDYVIESFNKDLPYNRFVTEQLAGDLLPPNASGAPNRNGIVATGFLALGAKAVAQQDKKKMLYDVYDEQVDVTSKAFLGMTVACARCHNHKFDPILAKDYYSMVSMFASTRDFEKPEAFVSKLLYVPLVPANQYAKYKGQQDRMEALKTGMQAITSADTEQYVRKLSGSIADYMIAARGVYEGKRPEEEVAKTTGTDPALLKKWVKYLSEGSKAHPQLADWENAAADKQREVALAYQKRFQAQLEDWSKVLDKWRTEVMADLQKDAPALPDKPKFEPAKDQFFYETFEHGPFAFSKEEFQKIGSAEAREKIAALQKEHDRVKASADPEPDMACAVQEGEKVQQKVLLRGDYNNPGEDAPRSVPRILARSTDPSLESGSGRLQFADWITRPDNPLAGRVIVNRIWMWHFGEGIIRTPDNFGKTGDRPSHPELLDYLARTFIEKGWSIKSLTRMIMLSSTYQTASDADEKTVEADPENRLLARFNRQRLDVEEIRDSILSLGGSLDPTMGGTLQKGFGTDSENSADRLSLDPLKITRRTVYLPLRRANLPTLLNLFDFGDATTVNGKRALTNVAPQALFMMNSEFVLDHSRKVAESLLAEKDASDSRRIQEAYLRILNRTPASGEVDSALTYLKKYETKFGGSAPELSAWQSLCHVLISSNEFLYLD
jgi:transposase-like protein